MRTTPGPDFGVLELQKLSPGVNLVDVTAARSRIQNTPAYAEAKRRSRAKNSTTSQTEPAGKKPWHQTGLNSNIP